MGRKEKNEKQGKGRRGERKTFGKDLGREWKGNEMDETDSGKGTKKKKKREEKKGM